MPRGEPRFTFATISPGKELIDKLGCLVNREILLLDRPSRRTLWRTNNLQFPEATWYCGSNMPVGERSRTEINEGDSNMGYGEQGLVRLDISGEMAKAQECITVSRNSYWPLLSCNRILANWIVYILMLIPRSIALTDHVKMFPREIPRVSFDSLRSYQSSMLLTICAGNWFADRNEWPNPVQ